MYVSELEYERDPTLLKTRLYDDINPYVFGYEEYNKGRGILSAEGNRLLREEAKVRQLAAQNCQYSK